MKIVYRFLFVCLSLGLVCACGEDNPELPNQEITPGGDEPGGGDEPDEPEEPIVPVDPIVNVNANDSVDGMAYVTDYSMPHLNAAHIYLEHTSMYNHNRVLNYALEWNTKMRHAAWVAFYFDETTKLDNTTGGIIIIPSQYSSAASTLTISGPTKINAVITYVNNEI